MKPFFIFISTLFLLFSSMNGVVYGANTTSPSDNHAARAALAEEGEPRLDHTRREEAEGKAIWEKLQSKETSCDKLSEDDLERLGEYFMGQMAGGSHETMNNMMVRMMGEEGEKQMHIAMGKRNSGCDTSFIPMMGSGFGNMMGGWGGFGIFGWITMLVFWFLLILGVVALLRYVGVSGGHTRDNKTPLEILKERYAKGDIDKKEYEERKKDLS